MIEVPEINHNKGVNNMDAFQAIDVSGYVPHEWFIMMGGAGIFAAFAVILWALAIKKDKNNGGK